MKIEVKQEHIDKGIRYKCDACPVALAIKEQINPHGLIVRNNIIIKLKSTSKIMVLFIPKKAQTFIMSFDALRKVEPFVFDLAI